MAWGVIGSSSPVWVVHASEWTNGPCNRQSDMNLNTELVPKNS